MLPISEGGAVIGNGNSCKFTGKNLRFKIFFQSHLRKSYLETEHSVFAKSFQVIYKPLIAFIPMLICTTESYFVPISHFIVQLQLEKSGLIFILFKTH